MQTTMIHARPTGQRTPLGEVIRWGPLGPGGDPEMSLQSYVPGVPVSGLGRLGEVIQWGPLGPGGDPAASLQSWTRGQYVSGLGQANGGGAAVEAGYGAQVTLPRMETVMAGAAGFALGVAVGWFVGGR